jgi:hypothetical protein
MVMPAVSVISRLPLVALPQLVRTTFLVSFHPSTQPDPDKLLVETRLVLSVALVQRLFPQLHLLMLVVLDSRALPSLWLLRQLRMFLPQQVSTAAVLTQMATKPLVSTMAFHQHFLSTVFRPVHRHRSLRLRPRVVMSRLPRPRLVISRLLRPRS